jgi:23S rRNA (pseudouridine1915-N3)-methyltransferase
MKILFLSVGKPKQPEATVLFEDYSSRIRRIGLEVESRWVKEASGDGRFTGDQLMEREAAALRSALPDRSRVIALDRSGDMMDSRQLASRIEGWTTPRGVFVIGGPLGLHSSFLAGADQLWSLSPLTFPHDLARAVVSEQVYRALTLVRRIPYHK